MPSSLPLAPASPEAPKDCPLCARLVSFRIVNREAEPSWFNDPVPSFGDETGRLAIIGLAPGLRGANRTGRPFTGDGAGEVLYPALLRAGFAQGTYEARADDGFTLKDCIISNAVRCVPPENKPTTSEIATCRRFLVARIAALPNLRAVLALGRIAHDSSAIAFGRKPSQLRFAHGALHELSPRLRLYDSYHCSRYNMNTGVLTTQMLDNVLSAIRKWLGAAPR